MADEVTKLILGDTAISAIEQAPPRRRRFFGQRKRQRPPLTHCENCGAPLSGPYCAQCGQAAIDYRRSFGHVLVDVLNEFLAGHRVRYVHPLRLYLLASILFFFAVNYWAKSIPPTSLSDRDRAEIQAELKNEDLPPDARAKLEKALGLDSPAPTSATPNVPTPPGSPPEASTKTNQTLNKEGERAFFQSGNPQTPFEKWLETRAKEKMGAHGSNMQLFLRTLISNLPYMVLCCIPLFALVLKLLYIRRKVFYIDHLIYALHIHTFAYLAVMLIVAITIGLNGLVPGALAGWIIGLLWVTFAVQIFLSIRRVYRQGWFFTVFKFFLGGFVYLIVLFMALGVTFFITLAMP